MKQFSGATKLIRTLCQKQGLSIFAALGMLLAIPLLAVAQSTTATIIGTITDPGGAQIPGAKVLARNVDTGLTRSVVSGDDGAYRIEFLPVGKYSLEITPTSGF